MSSSIPSHPGRTRRRAWTGVSPESEGARLDGWQFGFQPNGHTRPMGSSLFAPKVLVLRRGERRDSGWVTKCRDLPYLLRSAFMREARAVVWAGRPRWRWRNRSVLG